MTRRRTVGDQVKSGLQIGGSIVLAFLFFAALIASANYFLGQNSSSVSRTSQTFGGLALAGLAAILFLTTRYWTKWVIGFLAYCLLRFVGALLFGPYLKKPVSRLEVAGWIAYLLIAVLLTMRHSERFPKRAERVVLVGFVLGATFALSLNSFKPLLFGLAVLFFGEVAEMFARQERRKRRENNSIVQG
jgi:hypothetical protein